MAQSTDVNLPRSHEAQFPECCVVCEKDNPQSQLRIVAHAPGLGRLTNWILGKGIVVKAPACPGCSWKLHGLRLATMIVMLAISAAIIWWVWPHLKDMVPRGLRPFASIGLVLACLFPITILKVFFADPFDITSHSDSIEYEFKSRHYAIVFATMNMDAAWVKMNGVNMRFKTKYDPGQSKRNDLPRMVLSHTPDDSVEKPDEHTPDVRTGFPSIIVEDSWRLARREQSTSRLPLFVRENKISFLLLIQSLMIASFLAFALLTKSPILFIAYAFLLLLRWINYALIVTALFNDKAKWFVVISSVIYTLCSLSGGLLVLKN